MQKSFADLQTKYENDTKDYQAKLQKQSYEFAVQRAVSDIQFSSKAAKNEFVRALTEKNLPLQDGMLLGLTEYIEKQKQEDPDAFKKVEEKQEKKPEFAPPAKLDKTPKGGEESKFGFHFMGVRKQTDD